MNLSRLAVTRPIGTLVITAIVMFAGVIAVSNLAVELLPEITFPRLSVSTTYPGAGPEEVENLVTRILEEAVSTVAGVREVFSSSSEGSSNVTVTFGYGTDLNEAANDVRAALERARRRLPENAGNPTVFKFDPSQFPIIQMGLVGDRSQVELRQIADDQILFRLERIPGVALVDVRGGLRRQIRVELDRARMQALGLSESDVVRALAASNLAAPGGDVIVGTRQLGLRTLSQYRNVEQIRQTVVTTRQGAPIYVRDVARVTEGPEEQRSIVRVNSRPGVLIAVQRTPGQNTVVVADRVLQEVSAINGTLSGAELIVVGDNARLIRNSIRSIRQNVLVGGALAIGVLAFFLRDLRSVLIIGSIIPVSLVPTFGLMYMFGYTLNLMTFGGLALAIGSLMDVSVVVLENIFRHREDGRPPREASLVGAQEVGSAVVASTLTQVVVFLPVIFLRGGAVTTQLFYQFSAVVIIAQLVSLVVALTLIPVLTVMLPPGGGATAGRAWMDRLSGRYRGTLEWALRHRAAVFAASAVIFLVGLGTYRLIGREVIPPADEGEMFVSVALPVGTRLELTAETMMRFEQVVRQEVPELLDMTVSGGTANFGSSRSHRGSIRIRLVERSRRSRSTDEVAAALRQRLRIPGGRVFVRPSAGAFNVLRFNAADPIEVDIRGFDLDQGFEVASQVQDTLEQIPGVTDVSVGTEERVPELTVRIDTDRAAAFGLTPTQISQTLQVAVGGTVATIVRQGGSELDVIVRLRESDRREITDVLAIPIVTPTGRQIPLAQVAELVRGQGPAQIARKGRQRYISVSAGITGRDFGSVMSEVRTRLAALPLPDGFSLAYGEEYEEQRRADRQLSLGFLVAVVLVFAVMAVQFEALLVPLMILGSIPFALSGALLMLFLTQTTLNIQSLIGLIALSGVVANNAIVLIDFILTMRREGVPLRQAAIEASTARLRPVLMTTVTSVLGLLPIALGIGEGAELQAPLARSVLGGLTLSTLVTLVFLPTLYVTVGERGVGRRRIPGLEPRIEPGESRPAPVTGGSNGEEAEENDR